MERKISKKVGKARVPKTYRLQEETIVDIERKAKKAKCSPGELIEKVIKEIS